MSDEVRVRALRPFEGIEGYKDETSKPFPVSKQRAAELKANGLVEEVGAGKQAEGAENKKAAEPANKAEPAAANKSAKA